MSAPEGRPLLIGITGPIGCGKSTVARMLADRGAEVIDADALAREVTGPGSAALPEIRTRFGDAVLTADGSLDRSALAAVVFNDAAALADLERIVHPRVRVLVEHRLADAHAAGIRIVAIEAIKLVEGGLANRCDEVWLVDCSPQTQRARLAERGVDPRDAEDRLRAQGENLVDRLAAALDGSVSNRRLSTEGTLEQTRERVERALGEAMESRGSER